MSRDALAAAINAGIRAQIQPYRLEPVLESGTIDGAVYTAYVRVARFARRAHVEGRRVTPEQIPAAVKEPVLHVAMRWSGGDPVRPVENLSDIVIAALDRPASADPAGRSLYFHPKRLVHALWMEDVDRASAILGEWPFDHDVRIGVFPAELAEWPVLEFTAYRTYWTESGGTSRDMIAGFVKGPLK